MSDKTQAKGGLVVDEAWTEMLPVDQCAWRVCRDPASHRVLYRADSDAEAKLLGRYCALHADLAVLCLQSAGEGVAE